jgi:hypothetical protein
MTCEAANQVVMGANMLSAAFEVTRRWRESKLRHQPLLGDTLRAGYVWHRFNAP